LAFFIMASSLGVHGATIKSKSSNSRRAFQTLVTQPGDRGSLGLLFCGGGKVTLFAPNPTAGSPGINSEQKLDARTVEFFVLRPIFINPRFHDDTFLVGNLHIEGALVPCYPLEPPAMELASSR
jgi:hypothetical protein